MRQTAFTVVDFGAFQERIGFGVAVFNGIVGGTSRRFNADGNIRRAFVLQIHLDSSATAVGHAHDGYAHG